MTLTFDAFSAPVRETLVRLQRVLDPLEGDLRARWRGDGDLNGVRAPSGRSLRPAAVLALLIDHEDHLNMVFTRRADHLQAHAGQISFPGGRQNVGRETLAECALRETQEEIGLRPEAITVLGRFDPYETSSAFLVTPFVGVAKAGFDLNPDPGEVAEVFEVPFEFLMSARNHKRESREFRGALRHFYAMPYEDRYIWGATAGMVKALSDRLA
ncbi:NUDIX hydrolase [Woodsholea maritima]|uniref:NUDIX hydrolase n=1 Tax=Woodsholea maritima TaxID=240237 RepID=UPI0003621C00|nr:CoA pyrophosphatase [Woodsholea maritima]